MGEKNEISRTETYQSVSQSVSKILLALLIPSATFAVAQTIPQGTFKHVIIVVQENRTPDNLFGASPASTAKCGQEQQPIITGADIDNGGYGYVEQPGGGTKRQSICNIPLSLTGSYNVPPIPAIMVDPDHSHGGPWGLPQSSAWGFQNDWDSGNMDGFCHEYDTLRWTGVCPSYSYVPQTDVQPYFDIATYYGFANYMFQTSEGPSYPAHQFLFAGTSAPVPVNDPSGEWDWFASENVAWAGGGKSGDVGCTLPGGEWIALLQSAATSSEPAGWEPPDPNQNGNQGWCSQNPSDPHCSHPCYEREPYPGQNQPYTWGSLADLLGAQNPPVSWKYYTPALDAKTGHVANGFWVAPMSYDHFCLPAILGGDEECAGLLSGGPYYANMGWETSSNPVPILTDINNCALAAVSWAIPDALWSDHAGENNGSGPAYVANIVNAIGAATTCDGNKGYWSDTAIFITWDDWGGWYDHINPSHSGGPQVNQTPGTWGAFYTYGFRVPLLVVSAYTQPGYVSGACGAGTNHPTCPNLNAPFVHDFGSILAFTEWNFKIPIGSIGQENYPFADNYAPEWNQGQGATPLLDFFPLTTPRLFQQIGVPQGYGPSYFQNYFTNNPNASPSGPDAGEGDQ